MSGGLRSPGGSLRPPGVPVSSTPKKVRGGKRGVRSPTFRVPLSPNSHPSFMLSSPGARTLMITTYPSHHGALERSRAPLLRRANHDFASVGNWGHRGACSRNTTVGGGSSSRMSLHSVRPLQWCRSSGSDSQSIFLAAFAAHRATKEEIRCIQRKVGCGLSRSSPC